MSALGRVCMAGRKIRLPFQVFTSTASLVAAALALALLAWPAAAQQPPSGEGARACLKCHESDKIMGILETPHAKFDDPRTPAAREQCESCHGLSATHMKFPMQVGNIVFTKHGKTSIADRNQACLACHHKGERSHWVESAHSEKFSCASCHVMHKPKDPMMVKENQTKECAKCHSPILASAPTTTSHPLTGPKAMNCMQCHNPHGPTNLTTCATCHLQDAAALAKQSPKSRGFHARAQDRTIECTSCHKGFVHSMPPLTLAEPPNTP